MPSDTTIVFIVLAGAVGLFVWDRLRPDMVGLLILAALGLTGVLGPSDLLSGFGNEAVITIAAMFVLSAALTRTGVVAALGGAMARLSGGNPWRFLVFSVVSVGLIAPFINNTPVVLVFIPAVLSVCRRLGMTPSKFLMPISFASMLGGSCALVGTSTNLLVSALYADEGYERLGMFEFAWVGAPMLLVGLVYLVLLSHRLLPERMTLSASAALEASREYVTEVRVGEGSPLVGQTLSETPLADSPVRVAELIRGEQIQRLDPNTRFEAGDSLLVRGDLNEILELDSRHSLQILPELTSGDGEARRVEVTLAELMVAPSSPLIGQTCRQIRLRSEFGVSVFAIQRHGRHIRKKIADLELAMGDILLVRGPLESVRRLRTSDSFMVFEGVQEQVMERHKAPLAIGALALVIGLAAAGAAPISVLALTGVVFIVLARVVSAREAYVSVDWSILVLIAGTLGLGRAMIDSGAADMLGTTMARAAGSASPWLALGALYVLTTVMTAFVSNNATAVLLTPLAVSTAVSMGADPRPFVFAVAYASSNAYATPIGYQTNLLVYGPGGYFFRDFAKFGLPLNFLVFLVAWLLIPFVWPLTP